MKSFEKKFRILCKNDDDKILIKQAIRIVGEHCIFKSKVREAIKKTRTRFALSNDTRIFCVEKDLLNELKLGVKE